ncbi:MAG: hypothetical protein AAGC77_11485 [Pseudomonadota bacterium]
MMTGLAARVCVMMLCLASLLSACGGTPDLSAPPAGQDDAETIGEKMWLFNLNCIGKHSLGLNPADDFQNDAYTQAPAPNYVTSVLDFSGLFSDVEISDATYTIWTEPTAPQDVTTLETTAAPLAVVTGEIQSSAGPLRVCAVALEGDDAIASFGSRYRFPEPIVEETLSNGGESVVWRVKEDAASNDDLDFVVLGSAAPADQPGRVYYISIVDAI